MNSEERLRKYLEYSKNNVEINEYLMSYQIMKDIEEILNQNKQLKDSWNKLEEWLKELLQSSLNNWEQCQINDNVFASLNLEQNMNLLGEILSKMQEIQGGSDK